VTTTDLNRSVPMPGQLADAITIATAIRAAYPFPPEAACILASWFLDNHPTDAAAYAVDLHGA
jgi:hypothetical protein